MWAHLGSPKCEFVINLWIHSCLVVEHKSPPKSAEGATGRAQDQKKANITEIQWVCERRNGVSIRAYSIHSNKAVLELLFLDFLSTLVSFKYAPIYKLRSYPGITSNPSARWPSKALGSCACIGTNIHDTHIALHFHFHSFYIARAFDTTQWTATSWYALTMVTRSFQM